MQRIQEFLKHAKAADVNYQDTVRLKIKRIGVMVTSILIQCTDATTVRTYRHQNGNTALLNAVYSAHTDVVRILLTFPGIDVNIPHKVILSLSYYCFAPFAYHT